jgi:hypothetical protein
MLLKGCGVECSMAWRKCMASAIALESETLKAENVDAAKGMRGGMQLSGQIHGNNCST